MPNSIFLNVFHQIIRSDHKILLQLSFIIFSLVPAFLIYEVLKRTFKLIFKKSNKYTSSLLKFRSFFLLSWLFSIGILYPGFNTFFNDQNPLVLLVTVLIGAITLIRIIRAVAAQALKLPLSCLVAITAILLTTGFFQPLLNLLDKAELSLGVLHTSVLKIVQSVSLITVLTWVALLLSNRLDRKLSNNKHMSKSTFLLCSKIFRVSLVTFSIFFGMSLVGIDLSVISFFAGAIGVAIGFGLQNILSNIFCGIIILLDRSIRPGDVVTLTDIGTYGVVHKLNARYISIRTRAGIEHLIPNEVFINKKTENWTHSDPYIRISIPFHVALDSDLELVERLILDIARNTNRVTQEPAPVLRVAELTSYSVILSLRVWINDPMNGISVIKSTIYKESLKAFKEHGIVIPHYTHRIFEGQDLQSDLSKEDIQTSSL